MKQVTIETVRQRITELGEYASRGGMSLREEFELACLRQLLTTMEQPAPVVPDECVDKQAVCWMRSHSLAGNYRDGWNDCRAAMLQGAEPSPATDNTAQQFEALATGAHREPLVVVKINLPSHDHLDGPEREAFRKAVNICHVEFAKQCVRNGIGVDASLGHDISEFESMFVGCWADNETTHQVNFVVRDDSE